jgi:hypothetical protein
MMRYGVFGEARTDDPNVIAIEVNTSLAPRIFSSDQSLKRFIARPSK